VTPRPAPRTPTVVALRILLLLGGGLLAALLVGTTAYSTAGVLVRTSQNADDTLRGTFTRVDVHVSGSVDVQPGPPGRARIERHSDYSFEEPQVSQRIEDGVLVLRYRCRGLTVVCDHAITLTVPADVALDVEADHAEVRDMTGSVRVHSGGGAAELERLSGTVDASVGGGAIIGRDLRSADVRADAGGGSIELEFSRAPEWVDASAGAGHVSIVVPRGAGYRVQASAGAGHTEIGVTHDPDSTRVIRATAGAGEVLVHYAPA
jgi:hypothetical protein